MEPPKTVQDLIDRDSEIICPSCGHFAGVYETCPRCGADVVKRTSLKVIKYSSLVLATIGLFCVYLWAKNRELETISISSIVSTMNFARVRIEKAVVVQRGNVKYQYGRPNLVSFRICDGDLGEEKDKLWVNAYGEVAEALIKSGKLPVQGDIVEVAGQIQVREGKALLILQTAEHLKITPALLTPLASVTEKMVDQEVKIRAHLVELEIPPEGSPRPVRVTISDGKETREMVLWRHVYEALSAPLAVGQVIEVCVKVRSYNKKLQLELRNPEDLEMKGRLDEDRSIKETLPSDSKAPSALPADGKSDGKNPSDGKTPVPANDREPSDGKTPVLPADGKAQRDEVLLPGQVKSEHLDRKVVVEGTIRKEYDFKYGTARDKKGKKWILGNGEGSIQVVIWQNIHEEIQENFTIGDLVRVTGKVEEYNGKLQVSPWSARDIVMQKRRDAKEDNPREQGGAPAPDQGGGPVLEDGEVPEKDEVPGQGSGPVPDGSPEDEDKVGGEPLRPGQVEKKHVGKTVLIEGIIAKEYKFSQGSKWILRGRDGSIPVVIWQSLVERLPQSFAVGDKIRVTGRVKEFRDKLEVHPSTPQEIVLIEKKDYLKIKEIGSEHVGQKIFIKGTVLDRLIQSDGVILPLEDETGKIEVILRRDQFQMSQIFYILRAGYRLKIRGTVLGSEREYRLGEMTEPQYQIQPESEADIEILSRPPTPEKEKKEEPTLPEVVITGEALFSKIIPPGLKMVITEVKGMPHNYPVKPWDCIEVIVPAPPLSDLDFFKALTQGSLIEVTGKLNRFRNTYQVEVVNAQAIRLIESAPLVIRPPQETAPQLRKTAKKRYTEEGEEETWIPVTGFQQLAYQETYSPLLISGKLCKEGEKWRLLLEGGKISLILENSSVPELIAESRVKVKGFLIRKGDDVGVLVLSIEVK